MRLFRYIFYIAFILFMLAFSMANRGKVSFKLPFSEFSFNTYLYILLIAAIMIGGIFGYFIGLKDIFKIKRKAAIEKKNNKEVERKLALYESEVRIMESAKQENLKLQQSTTAKQILLQK